MLDATATSHKDLSAVKLSVGVSTLRHFYYHSCCNFALGNSLQCINDVYDALVYADMKD